MQRFKKKIYFIFLFLIFFLPKISGAQELIQISIHSNEALYVHSSENVGIFSDLKNSGIIGTYPNSIIHFFGQRWSNRAGSRLVDESTNGTSGSGGQFKFKSLTNSPQFIETQNIQNDIGFPSIAIANSGNVSLEGTDLIIRRNLNFESGRLILNNRNAVLSATATITGFDNNKFVVTGTGTSGGYLVRNSTGTQQPDLIFPIGTTVSSYTPASINYRGVPQNIKLRVFENVYDKAVLGAPNNTKFLPKTWNVAFTAPDPNALITLNTQHNSNEEGAIFAANRLKSFIARYKASNETWDTSTPSIGPATITSGNPIANAYLHTRTSITGIALNEYFAKSISEASPLAGLRIPAGISPNNDGLNEKFIIQNLNPNDKVRLDIYNRWQTLVFRDGNYKNTFDGIGNQKGLINNELPDGTYYYILNINAEKAITGYIIINR